jgi:hypothetical protein
MALDTELFTLIDACSEDLERAGVDPAEHQEFLARMVLAALVFPVGNAIKTRAEIKKAIIAATRLRDAWCAK